LTQGTITLEPFVRFPGVEATPRPQESPYTIELPDATSTSLALYPFEPQTVDDIPPDEDQIALLNEVVPYMPGTAFIVVSKDGRVLAKRAVSPHAPDVKVLYPNGGETLQGPTVTVIWQASDADGDPLTYSLLYSADAGQTWRSIDAGITQVQFSVNLQELPGSNQALFRVIATDGVNTSMDESDAFFHVPSKIPQVQIISPDDGSSFSTAQTVVLVGEATDLEEGNLDGAAVLWSSDLQGVLGFGRSIAVTSLIPGTHVVTLDAQDASGAEGTASILIEVTEIPPVLDFMGEVIPVIVDIKPGEFPNLINITRDPNRIEVIPVAILTTSIFDAATVDPRTVRFGKTGTEAAPVQTTLADANGDGALDLILRFRTQDTGLQCGDTVAELTAQTMGREVIQGSDAIVTMRGGVICQ
jgi:hypothetical protein